jgi:iron complex outermembrane receptor protein
MKTYVLAVFVCCLPFIVSAQFFHGQVKDEQTKSGIPYATIYFSDLDLGILTDSVGYFYCTREVPLSFKLRIAAPGYQTSLVSISLVDGLNRVFYLKENHIDLEEITVSGTRSSLQKQNVIQIESLKLQEIKSLPVTSLADALTTIKGVYATSTGPGISKPVIRGLQGMRVITLLNGLRIENQQWGGDHGLGLTDLGIGTVEVIKGPASLLYGADAIGGVLYMADENYPFQGKISTGFWTQLESNSLGVTSGIHYKQSFQNKGFTFFARASNHADYGLPNGKFAENSRFKEQALKASYRMNKKNWSSHVRYAFTFSSIGIPGHTHDSIIDFNVFQVDQQSRSERIPDQEFRNHFFSIENKFHFTRGQLVCLSGLTSNRLTEYEEKVTIPGIDMNLLNVPLTVRLEHKISEKWMLLSGYQGMFAHNSNGVEATEKLMPETAYMDNGAFIVSDFSIRKLHAQIGLRIDRRRIESMESFKGSDPIKKQYMSFNFSSGLVHAGEKLTTRANVTSGFRAPHITELLSNGFHHGALRYEIGNPNLGNERATQLDLSLETNGEHLQFSLNPFGNAINDFISIIPVDSSVNNLPVYRYQAFERISLYGSDIGFHYHPHFAHRVHVDGTFSWINYQSNQGENLALLPQNRFAGVLKVNVFSWNRFEIEDIVLQYQYFFAQNRVATYETTTSGFQLLNASVNARITGKHSWRFQLGVKNLFNVSYIDHLSRLKNIEMPQPGRNVFLKVNYQFNQK